MNQQFVLHLQPRRVGGDNPLSLSLYLLLFMHFSLLPFTQASWPSGCNLFRVCSKSAFKNLLRYLYVKHSVLCLASRS
jgi:hypothetical protein